jgi:hypothetical protein
LEEHPNVDLRDGGARNTQKIPPTTIPKNADAISIARQQKSSPGDAEISSAVASLLGLPKPSAELRALVRSLAT